MNWGKLDKKILRYILEICVVILLTVFSYNSFLNSGLSSYADIAFMENEEFRDLEVIYGRKSDREYQILSNENVLDSGFLTISNPNSYTVTSLLTIKINSSSLKDISLIDVEVNGNIIDYSKFSLKDEYYVATVEKRELSSFEKVDYDVKIYGNALYVDTNNLLYHFNITQSFYH